MKHLFLSIFLLAIAASESTAQWTNFGFDYPVIFWAQDTILFASEANNEANNGEHLYRYTPWGPQTWSVFDTGINIGYPPAVMSMGSLGPYFYAGCNGGGIFRSSDSGRHWAAINKGFGEADVISIVTMDSVLFAGGGGLYRSYNYGTNWVNLNHFGGALAVLGTTLFVGKSGGIVRSTDSGNTWTISDTSINVTTTATLGTYIFAGTDGSGIYRSTDNGEHWTAVNAGLLNLAVSSLVTDGKNLFAGTGYGPSIINGNFNDGSGVFLSTDSGTTWDTVNTGLPEGRETGCLNISTLCIFDTFLIAGTWQNGGQFSYSFVRSIAEMVKKDTTSAVVQQGPQLALTIAAYPNPLSNSATISYTLPESGTVTIVVSDALGRTISYPVSGFEDAGTHEATFDASSIPSGIYWCRIETMDGSQMSKLIIQK